ncbi:MAG: universal stress protein [Haloferacaceae archaeon]
MYDRLLVPVDGTSGATRAVEYGLSLARATGAAVDLLFVVDDRLDDLVETDEGKALLERSEKAGRRATAEIAEREPDLEVERTVRHGRPFEEILAHAEDRDVDLCVLGGGRETERDLGSTAERVVTLSGFPVITVPDSEEVESASLETLEDVLVATDGSAPAERAATEALGFAERFGATLHAVYVVDTTVYDLEDAPRSIVGLLRQGGENVVGEITAEAKSVNVPVSGQVLRGRPADEIREYAEGVDAGLIALGTRGRGGLPERLLGSTTRRTVRDADRPVLSVA